jgi:tetratricopeptide (TPR) repeat protein
VWLIILAGLAAYANSLSDAFVFDDIDAIVSNHAIRHLWPPWKFFASPNRPILNLSLAVSCALSGGRSLGMREPNVVSYHAFNIAVHVLAALTLFGLVRRTLQLPALPAQFEDSSATSLALATALLWELHPLQTESVTYIIQRAESLAGLFYLLTLYCVIRASSPCEPHSSYRSKGWYVAAVAACALGTGTKETVATAPLAVFLYDRIFLSGSFRETLRRRWGLYLALAATWALPAWMILSPGTRQPVSAGFRMPGIAPMDYAVTQLGVILHYLKLSFWPAGLCLDYNWQRAKGLAEILPGAVVVGALLAATAAALALRPPWGFLGAWFFLTLAPTSSFMPIADAAAEHRMYLPLAAVAAFAVIGGYLLIGRLSRRPGGENFPIAQSPNLPISEGPCASLRQDEPRRTARAWPALVVFLIAALLGNLTALRNLDYRSELSIWQDTVRKAPHNPRAFEALGKVYFEKQEYSRAIEYHTAAIQANPNYAPAYNGRAIVYNELGRFEEALQDCDEAIRLDPDLPVFRNTRGVVLAHMGKYDLAIRDYDQAIELNASFADAWMNRGVACGKIGRLTEALTDFDRAIALRPDYPSAYYNRGNTYFDQDDYDRAIRDYTHAIALKRDYLSAYWNRASAYFWKKDYRRAWADVRAGRGLGAEPPPQLLQQLSQAAPE